MLKVLKFKLNFIKKNIRKRKIEFVLFPSVLLYINELSSLYKNFIAFLVKLANKHFKFRAYLIDILIGIEDLLKHLSLYANFRQLNTCMLYVKSESALAKNLILKNKKYISGGF